MIIPVSQTCRIAVKTAPEATEVLEFPIPPIGETEGLLRIEACGVGGAEPEHYRSPRRVPIAMGHQIVGTIVALGAKAGRMWNVELGERVAPLDSAAREAILGGNAARIFFGQTA